MVYGLCIRECDVSEWEGRVGKMEGKEEERREREKGRERGKREREGEREREGGGVVLRRSLEDCIILEVCAYMRSTHCVHMLRIHVYTVNISIYGVAVASCGVGEHNNLLYERYNDGCTATSYARDDHITMQVYWLHQLVNAGLILLAEIVGCFCILNFNLQKKG